MENNNDNKEPNIKVLKEMLKLSKHIHKMILEQEKESLEAIRKHQQVFMFAKYMTKPNLIAIEKLEKEIKELEVKKKTKAPKKKAQPLA